MIHTAHSAYTLDLNIMPSRTERAIPSFPTDVPTADISSVDFERLANGDPDETTKVFDAARGYGFFYLDNTHIDSDFMFDLANETFSLPLDEKMQFEMGSTGRYFGYKMSGSTIVDAKGTPDCVRLCRALSHAMPLIRYRVSSTTSAKTTSCAWDPTATTLSHTPRLSTTGAASYKPS